MHQYDEHTEQLAQAVLAYVRDRARLDPVPLDGPRPQAELDALVGPTITEDGLGGLRALQLFDEHLSSSCISVDHPRYLSFIPAAPTEASMLFDLVVGASSIYGGSWLEGAGAVYAENQALRWLADLAGFPDTAGGVFMPGGTVGNLSALVTARHRAKVLRSGTADAESALPRWAVAASAHTHSSVEMACDVMDVDFRTVGVDDRGRMTGETLRRALRDWDVTGPEDGVFAVVATAGTTNLGIVDELASVAEVCAEFGLWFHVDGAYGLAALAAPSARGLFEGIDRADSFIVDPHKWLFAPFDSCALLYRDPRHGRAAHTQRAGYLDVLTGSAEWNPSDYGVGLSRRARGLPFWFSLATHGTRAYSEAVERALEVARYATAQVRRRDYLELVWEPTLSVVAFRRLGWTAQQYHAWSDRLLLGGVAFVMPTIHDGETVTRLAVVNPRTSEADIDLVLDSMA